MRFRCIGRREDRVFLEATTEVEAESYEEALKLAREYLEAHDEQFAETDSRTGGVVIVTNKKLSPPT